MDKPITTALFIVISIVLAVMLFNVAYPAVQKGGDAINNMASRAEDRMKTQIAVIHAAAEIDSSGWWQDTNGNGDVDVFVWVKNVGDTRITALDHMDVFFGAEGNFTRIPYRSAATGSYPYWSGQIEGGSDWNPTTTLKITIHYNATLAAGRYYAKVTLPSGNSDQYFLSI